MSELVDRATAARLLLGGAVVALPTDTVYGVAAALSHPLAVARLFEVKHRPTTTALPVLIEGVDAVNELGVTWSDVARRLGEVFWPGPLTLVVGAPTELAAAVGSRDATVGLRVPDDDDLRGLLRVTGPLAVTSANEHGHAPCHSAAEVLAVFAGANLSGVLDGGERHGDVSTVVEVYEGGWRVVRDGALSSGELARALV